MVEAVLQAPRGDGGGFVFSLAETERQHHGTIAAGKIDLAGQRHIAVIGALVLVGEPSMPGQLLPAIRRPDETGGHCAPRRA